MLPRLSAKFDLLYAGMGPSSITLENTLHALLLQTGYSVRLERRLVEQINDNLSFRWFLCLGMDEAVWNRAAFSKIRDRLLTADVEQRFFAEVKQQAMPLMSDKQFTSNGG